MAKESPSKLSRSMSLPSRLSPAIATDPPPATAREPSSSITRPYRLVPSSTKGFTLSSTKPSALLQRRTHATQGLSEVKAFTDYNPPPPPPPPPSTNPPSAYDVLQIPPSATQQEVKAAYWRLARQHHPDKVPLDRKEASSILFLEIHAAYLALKDPDTRTRYDLQMSLQSSRSSLTELRTPHFCSPSPNVFTPHSQLYTPRVPVRNPYTPRSQSNTPKVATGADSSLTGFRTSHFCSPSPNVFTPRSQLYTPTGPVPNPYTPRSQSYTPKVARVADSSPNVFTPRTPFSTGRNWETDQCW